MFIGKSYYLRLDRVIAFDYMRDIAFALQLFFSGSLVFPNTLKILILKRSLKMSSKIALPSANECSGAGFGIQLGMGLALVP